MLSMAVGFTLGTNFKCTEHRFTSSPFPCKKGLFCDILVVVLGAIKGELNPGEGFLSVRSAIGRDVRESDVPSEFSCFRRASINLLDLFFWHFVEQRRRLEAFSKHCETVLNNIQQQVARVNRKKAEHMAAQNALEEKVWIDWRGIMVYFLGILQEFVSFSDYWGSSDSEIVSTWSKRYVGSWACKKIKSPPLFLAGYCENLCFCFYRWRSPSGVVTRCRSLLSVGATANEFGECSVITTSSLVLVVWNLTPLTTALFWNIVAVDVNVFLAWCPSGVGHLTFFLLHDIASWWIIVSGHHRSTIHWLVNKFWLFPDCKEQF